MIGAVPYPSSRETDVVLRDGSTVHVRPIRPADEEELREFLEGLSVEARTFRFFSAGANMTRAAREAADVDYRGRYGLVAVAGEEARIVGHAQYVESGPGTAEVAFAIGDSFQGRGLGTILLAHVAEAAAEAGYPNLVAEVMPANHRMIEVFRESGFAVETASEPGVVHVQFPSSMSPEAVRRFEQRDRLAAVAAVEPILRPRSIAVIGASRRRGTVGGEVLHNVVTAGFQGPVYPINQRAGSVQSVPAYGRVTDVPGPVDLAVIAVPAEQVLEVAHECAAKGVRALVVISAGFAEVGDEGRRRQQELLAVCRAAGMRIVGPNCMGVLNLEPSVSLDATFAPTIPEHGHVAFASQSGALGLAVFDQAAGRGLGLSSFVSAGNKADISGNDLIQFWEADDDTSVILLYLESFGNPRRFARIARRVGRSKPIVAVKSGRSAAGARGAASHTGALLASDVTVDALFRQAGVIRTDTLAEMFDVASLLAAQPPPAGPRVGIVTNAGGLGILCADACDAGGLEVVELPAKLRSELAQKLPGGASVVNPVDMIATAAAEDYERVVGKLCASRAVDAVIALFIPPLSTQPEEVARAIRRAASHARRGVPVLAVIMGGGADVAAELAAGDAHIPLFRFPEEAARALSLAAGYGEWRRNPEEPLPQLFDVRSDEAAAVLASALGEESRWLGHDEIAALLGCYGLPLVESRYAATPTAVGRVARELGDRVALKAVAPGLLHKSDAGGVQVGLRGARQASSAAAAMAASVAGEGYELKGFLVQPMVAQGAEMLVGMTHDRLFGPVVACAAGGVAVELIKDVSVRLAPLTEADARDMVHSLATFPLLDGYRGAPRADVHSLEDVLMRVSAMAEAHPEIAELDLNPVIVGADGAAIVDARIRVAPASPRRPAPSLGA